jgi:hypothetical protein
LLQALFEKYDEALREAFARAATLDDGRAQNQSKKGKIGQKQGTQRIGKASKGPTGAWEQVRRLWRLVHLAHLTHRVCLTLTPRAAKRGAPVRALTTFTLEIVASSFDMALSSGLGAEGATHHRRPGMAEVPGDAPSDQWLHSAACRAHAPRSAVHLRPGQPR